MYKTSTKPASGSAVLSGWEPDLHAEAQKDRAPPPGSYDLRTDPSEDGLKYSFGSPRSPNKNRNPGPKYNTRGGFEFTTSSTKQPTSATLKEKTYDDFTWGPPDPKKDEENYQKMLSLTSPDKSHHSDLVKKKRLEIDQALQKMNKMGVSGTFGSPSKKIRSIVVPTDVPAPNMYSDFGNDDLCNKTEPIYSLGMPREPLPPFALFTPPPGSYDPSEAAKPYPKEPSFSMAKELPGEKEHFAHKGPGPQYDAGTLFKRQDSIETLDESGMV